MKRFIGSLGLVLVLLGCSQEATRRPSEDNALAKSGQTTTLHLAVTAGGDATQLALIPQTNTPAGPERLKALTMEQYDAGGGQMKQRLKASPEFDARLFLRNSAGTARGYIDYTFLSDGYDALTGAIQLVSKTDVVTYHSITGAVPTDADLNGGGWRVCGIIGGAYPAGNPESPIFRPNTSLGTASPDEIDMPLVADWVTIGTDPSRPGYLSMANLAFKPDGVLAYVELENKWEALGHKYDVVNLPLYIYGTNSGTPAEIQYYVGGPSKPNYIWTSAGYTNFWLNTQITVNATKKIHGYLWFPLNPSVMGYGINIRQSTGELLVAKSGENSAFGYAQSVTATGSAAKIGDGKRVQIKLEIRRPVLPIEYMDDQILAGGGDRQLNFQVSNDGVSHTQALHFVPETSENVGYYAHYVVRGTPHAQFNPQQRTILHESINGELLDNKYFIPEFDDWWGILPSAWDAPWGTPSATVATRTEAFRVGQLNRFKGSSSYSATVHTEPGYSRVLYAIRFEPVAAGAAVEWNSIIPSSLSTPSAYTALTDQNYRSAYRYRLAESGGATTGFSVDVVYLGRETSVNLATISDPNWWNAHASQTITRHFPVAGYAQGSSLTTGLALVNYHVSQDFWSYTEMNSTQAGHIFFINSILGANELHNGRERGHSIRLFKKRP